jgi:hypothetical protein
MKIRYQLGTVVLAAVVSFSLAMSARAQIITNVLVNDTWRAGDRLTPGVYPSAPLYAENNGVIGTDADSDGDLSSAWFKGGSGTLAVVTNNPPITGPNILQMSTGASGSSHWYTYFTQSGTAVTLSAPGQELKLTWVFTPTGVNSLNSNQGLTIALGLTPGARSTNDMTLAPGNYTNAFAAFMNVGNTLGTPGGISLRKWTAAGSGSLAGTSGNYSSQLASGGASLTTGYSDGTQYTFTMDLSLTGSGLQVTESVTGGSIGGSGTITASYLDASFAGGSVSYDTFMIRPTSQAITASTFDTSLFQVETITAVPEPSTVALIAMGLGLMAGVIRRRRRS